MPPAASGLAALSVSTSSRRSAQGDPLHRQFLEGHLGREPLLSSSSTPSLVSGPVQQLSPLESSLNAACTHGALTCLRGITRGKCNKIVTFTKHLRNIWQCKLVWPVGAESSALGGDPLGRSRREDDIALTDEEYAEVERYNAWAKKLSGRANVAARTRTAFRRRGRILSILLNSSTRSLGPLEQLTAFPTAVFNPQLGAWQLALPSK